MSGDPKSALRVPTWAQQYINPQASSGTGFQRGHMRGDTFWADLPTDFQAAYAELDRFGIGRNYTSNFELLSETQRGGAVFGATTHSGRHADALNEAQYDTTGNRETFWNKQKADIERVILTTPAGSDERERQLRSLARRDYIYSRYLGMSNLDQDVLNRAGFDDTVSLANNNTDWRSGSTAFGGQTTNDYLASNKVKNSQLATTVEGSKLWRALNDLIPDDDTFDVTTAEKDYAYRKLITDAIPDYQRLAPPLNQSDLHPRIAAELAFKNAHVSTITNEDGTVDYDRYKQLYEDKPGYWDQVRRVEAMIRDLVASGIDIIGKSLHEIEAAFTRAFRTSADKMREFADYTVARAKLVLAAAREMGDNVPDFVKEGFKKADAHFRRPDGGIDRVRAGYTIASSALSITSIWVEWHKRKDTPGAFETYLAETARDSVSMTSLLLQGGIMAAAATPAGPVVMFAMGVVAGYSAIRSTVSYLASDDYGLDKDGLTYKVVKSIDDALTKFEGEIKAYLDSVLDDIKDGAEKLLEAFSGRSIEWISEEAVGLVVADELLAGLFKPDSILIGDDVSTLLGDVSDDWLVHRGGGTVHGFGGDDVLVGWLPEYIRAGEAIGGYAYTKEDGTQAYMTAREVRDAERAQQKALDEAARMADTGFVVPVPDPHAIRAEQDYSLVLDGGEGDDWVVSIWGDRPPAPNIQATSNFLDMLKATRANVPDNTPARAALEARIAAIQAKLDREKSSLEFSGVTTAGGLGRDWIYNISDGGVIWGDVIGGFYDVPVLDGAGNPVLDGDGLPETRPVAPEDSAANSDNIWYAPNVKVMDAQHHDVLKFYGFTLTGGDANGGILAPVSMGLIGAVAGAANFAFSRGDWRRQVYVDHLLPWMTYMFRADQDGHMDMYITNAFDQLYQAVFGDGQSEVVQRYNELAEQGILGGWMKIEDVDVAGGFTGKSQMALAGLGDFNMVFRAANPLHDILAHLPQTLITMALSGGGPLVDQAFSAAAAIQRFADGMKWGSQNDPLVIDLDGDGIETTEMALGKVYFDVDNDMFAERTGWLKGDDGFLVLDANGNGRIDSIAEMFGGVNASGFAELATLDSNGDGKITVADVAWAKLRVWQDKDRDGVTDAGELSSLDALRIVSLGAVATPFAVPTTTPQGARLTGYGDVTFAGGIKRRMYDAVFASNDTDTKYAGEGGRASWQSGLTLDTKGFGRVTDLSVAMANDIAFGQLATSTAAAMTAPNLRELVAQAGKVLGAWGSALEQTRELAPVLLSADGKTLLDRGVYVEDATGGYWTLASGAAVLGADGQPVARATLEQVLAQATTGGAAWRPEQQWSPSKRGTAVTHREEAPYLVKVEHGRAVILNYGIEQADGTWRLASGPATSYASKEVILALAHEAGTEWRVEEIGFNPIANVPVERIGVRFTDGVAVDYTVEVTGRDGVKFYVWARNLDRAIQLEWKTGNSLEFDLRNYAIEFDSLDEVNSTDDSTYRVEMLTPAQFHFAVSLGGIDFRPEMLSAVVDYDTGKIDYAVGPTAKTSLKANLSTDPNKYVSGIATMIDMLQPVMEQYIVTSRRIAVRLAMQGGLSSFARGIEYDVASDSYRPVPVVVNTTTGVKANRELAPLFEAIFAGAPVSNAGDAVLDYLTDWNEILWQIYPDYRPAGASLGGTEAIDQAYIMQMLLPAYEAAGLDLELRHVAHALSIDEERIVTHAPDATTVDGTDGIDFFYMEEGAPGVAQTYRGGGGADFYFVGRNSGDDYIYDQDTGGADQLRFTDVLSNDVKASRQGQDLILKIRGQTNFVRLTDQFLGEQNPVVSNSTRNETGVNSIVFADGVVWDRLRMAMEVVDKAAAADPGSEISLTGSGSGDVLWAGKGNDYISGGAGGDFYLYDRGDGIDIIDDQGSFSFGPLKAGLDILRFRGDITAKDLVLTRDDESKHLKIGIRDKQGVLSETDKIEIRGMFDGVRLNLGIFGDALGSSDGLDFIAPNMIERFIFEDGTSLDSNQIMAQVLLNAKTPGDRSIYGFINDNTLDGGGGNDFLQGRQGGDTYIVGRNYGHEHVEDEDISLSIFAPPAIDTLKFVDDIRWTDIGFERDGPSDTLTLRVTGADSAVTLDQLLRHIPILGLVNLIENIEFGDGTKWSVYQLLQHYIDIAKTSDGTTIYGFERISDVIDGGAGDDTLVGFGGNDRYLIRPGEGSDAILDSSGDDRVVFVGLDSDDVDVERTALDLVLVIKATDERIVFKNQYIRDNTQTYAIEHFQFADGTISFRLFNPQYVDVVGSNDGETLTGSDFAETIDGLAGNDTLVGGDGGDTYRWDLGYGNDTIIDRRVRPHWNDRSGVVVPVKDTIEFGGGLTWDGLAFTQENNNLVITIKAQPNGDRLVVKDHFRELEDQIELFKFADGSIYTMLDVEQYKNIAAGGRGPDEITGSLHSENTLDGREGVDRLTGGFLADKYAFTAGYDFDTIFEQTDSPNVLDRVVFGASVVREDLVIFRYGLDLVIGLGNGLDVLTIVGGLGSTKVEQFEFADGSTVLLDTLISQMLTGSAADERLVGFDNRNDVLAGAGGSDALEGGLGGDEYRFGLGDGSDSVLDIGGVDKIVFGAYVTPDLVKFSEIGGDILVEIGDGTDRLAVLGGYSANPVETFEFADGTILTIDMVRGLIIDGRTNAGQDVLDLGDLPEGGEYRPGPGHDKVILAQDATLVLSAGDAIDSVEMPSGVTAAKVVLESESAAGVTVRAAGDSSTDLVLVLSGGDLLVLRGALGTGAVPTIEFADGTSWDAAALSQRYVDGQATAGDDIIEGTSRGDQLRGLAGDDQIRGHAGNDRYAFARGDGRDIVSDSGGTDVLAISGYRPDELRVTQLVPGRNELVLTFADSSDEIVLRYDGNWNGVERIEFGDGTFYTLAQLRRLVALTATGHDDRIVSDATAETLAGGLGDDTLVGGGGGDTYRFARGDGHDRIEAPGAGDAAAVLRFGAGIVRSDVALSRNAAGELVLALAGSDDRVTLGLPATGTDPVIGSVIFTDGTTVSYTELAASVAATAGDDVLFLSSTAAAGAAIVGLGGNDRATSGAGADTLAGGRGDDTLEGAGGADVYLFALGDGQDTVFDTGTPTAPDTVRFATDILPGQIRFLSVGPQDLVIGIAGTDGRLTDDRLTLKDMFRAGTAATDYGIERFEFAGAAWDLSEILSRAFAGTAGADAIDLGTTLDLTTVLDGGAGDDKLAGGIGDTTYVFGRGYGRDTISDSGTWAGSNDTLSLKADIAAAKVVVVKIGNDLELRVKDSDDRLRLVGQAIPGQSPINQVVFGDGTPSWTAAQLLARAVSEAAAEALINPAAASANPFTDPLFGSASGGGGGTPVSATIGVLNSVQVPVGGLVTTGSATSLGNGTYQLTPDWGSQAGAVWGEVDLSKDVDWRARIYLGYDDYWGADGIAFALQNVGSSVLGGHGYQNGEFGALVPGSFGIAFDTWPNPDQDPNSDFSQIIINGVRGDTSVDPFHLHANLEDGAWHALAISWSAATKTLSYSLDGQAVGQKAYDAPNLLWGGDEQVWFGFGGATGGLSNTQQVALTSVTQTEPASPLGVGVDNIGTGLHTRQLYGSAAQNAYHVFVPLEAWGSQVDTITNFRVGANGDSLRIGVAQGLSGQVMTKADGADTLVYFVPTGAKWLSEARVLVRLQGIAPGSLVANNFAGTPFANIANDTLTGTPASETLTAGFGDNTLVGRQGNDVLIGGGGNDILHGGGHDDIYRFGRGDGWDTIWEYSANWRNDGYGGYDVVELGAGITPNDVVVTQAGPNDLVLSIVGTDDHIRIAGTVTNGDYRVEAVRFADGTPTTPPTTWTHSDLIVRALASASTDGDDEIYGNNESNLINGGAGIDTLHGGKGHDVLIGGSGNDILHGGGHDDIYRFGRGDGWDTIWEYSANWGNDGYGGYDVVELGAGITPDDVVVTQAGPNDLVLSIVGTEDRIRIAGTVTNGDYRVEAVRFADGTPTTPPTTWTHADLIVRALASASASTDGDDRITGSNDANVINGAGGDDEISGSHGDDVVIGGAGNDLLHGDGGNDTFRFARGDGQDTIAEFGDNSSLHGGGGFDVLEFAAGIAANDVTVRQQGTDLLLLVGDGADRVLLHGAVIGGDWRIEEVRFDGEPAWTHADLISKITYEPDGVTVVGNAADGSIFGTDADEILDAANLGSATLLGGGGFDVLDGSSGHDVLDGGAGDDWLDGGEGGDTYRFEAGFGQDTIQDGGYESSVIEFGPGLSVANLVIEADIFDGGEGVNIGGGELRFTGLEDRVFVNLGSISEIRFDDGTILYREDIEQLAIPLDSQDEQIGAGEGGAQPDLLEGGDGNDWIDGRSGNDELHGGGGDDDLEGDIGDDLLLGGSGNDDLEGDDGDDVLTGGSGNDYLGGGDGDDVLTGGSGNDNLYGDDGANVYRFSAGFGHDYIRSVSGLDWIEFDATIAVADVVVQRDTSERDEPEYDYDDYGLYLRIEGTSDLVLVRGYNEDGVTTHIAGVRFADGTEWTYAKLVADSVPTPVSEIDGAVSNDALIGGAGNDSIDGGRGDDTLEGGEGDDNLHGGSGDDILLGGAGHDELGGGRGSDVYRFAPGFGADTISEGFDATALDVVEFVGLTPTEIGIFHDRSENHLILRSLVSDDSLRLYADYYTGSPEIEEVRFANGTIWSLAYMLDNSSPLAGADLNPDVDSEGNYLPATLEGTAGDDRMGGSNGDDTLSGGAGNDELYGGRGDDVLTAGPEATTCLPAPATIWSSIRQGSGAIGSTCRTGQKATASTRSCSTARSLSPTSASPGPLPTWTMHGG